MVVGIYGFSAAACEEEERMRDGINSNAVDVQAWAPNCTPACLVGWVNDITQKYLHTRSYAPNLLA